MIVVYLNLNMLTPKEFLSAFNDMGYNIVFFDIMSLFGVKSVHIPVVIFVLLFGIFYINIKTKFYGIRHFKDGVKTILSNVDNADGKKVSPIKVMFSAVAGSTGIGSTAGIVGLIAMTNPGAVFWILVFGLLCTSFKFIEIYLSHRFRDESGQSVIGGPFRYIKIGLAEIGLPKLGLALSYMYIFLLIFGSFGGPNVLQSNQITQVISSNFSYFAGKEHILSGFIAILVFFIAIGGTHRVTAFLSTILPFLVGCLFTSFVIVTLYHFKNIPAALGIIMKDAFSVNACGLGIFVNMLLRTSQRAALCTETTFGTTSILHSNSSQKDSIKEGMSGMLSPVITIFFVSFMSGLVAITSGVYLSAEYKGIVAISYAFGQVWTGFKYVLIFAIPFMSLNVIISWCYYGVKATVFLFKKESSKYYFLAVYCFVVFLGGCIDDFDVVFKTTDILNTSLAIPNVIAIVLMYNKIIKPKINKK